jgi:Cyclic nucleotide-binding domain
MEILTKIAMVYAYRRWIAILRDEAMLDQSRYGATPLGEEQIKLLSLVDIFEPLSREEIEAIHWEHLNTTVERGEIFFTPMDLCETLFVLQRGRIRLYRATPEGREFTVAVVESGTVFGEMVLTARRRKTPSSSTVRLMSSGRSPVPLKNCKVGQKKRCKSPASIPTPEHL